MRRHIDNRMSDNNDEFAMDGGASVHRHSLRIEGREATPREYARVMNAQSPDYSEEEIQVALQENATRPFSILRRR